MQPEIVATSELDSISDRISTHTSGAGVSSNLGWTNVSVAGNIGVDLGGIRGHRTRHSEHDYSRDHCSCSLFCGAGISSARRSDCGTFAGDSSDRLRTRVDNIGPLGKMG